MGFTHTKRNTMLLFLIAAILVIIITLYLLEQSGQPEEDRNLPNNITSPIATSTLNYVIPDAPGERTGGVYKNAKYGYQIHYPKGVSLNQGGDSEADVVGFSVLVHNVSMELDVYANHWENIVPILGTGIDINTFYSGDLKTFAQTIWQLEGSNFDSKTVESVTDLTEVRFAGTHAYTFIATTKTAPYIKPGSTTQKTFLIFEHLGKRIVILYSNGNPTIGAMLNTFEFTELNTLYSPSDNNESNHLAPLMQLASIQSESF